MVPTVTMGRLGLSPNFQIQVVYGSRCYLSMIEFETQFFEEELCSVTKAHVIVLLQREDFHGRENCNVERRISRIVFES
jgi:ribose 1,5-bisphosphokinase PhnN